MKQAPSATTNSTPDSTPSSNSLVSFNVAVQIPLKLNATNYIYWRLQFTTLLRGYDLLGFVDGSRPCPVKTDSSYPMWVRQDQLLLNAIISSLSPNLIPFIASAATSQAAWSTLARTYGKSSRGRIIQLKTQLNQLVKGDQTITEFMQQVKMKVDELAMMNATVDIEYLIITILNGLDDEYKELAHAIQARDTPVTFEELHEMLLNHEAHLATKKTSPPVLPMSAHAAAKSSYTPKEKHKIPVQEKHETGDQEEEQTLPQQVPDNELDSRQNNSDKNNSDKYCKYELEVDFLDNKTRCEARRIVVELSDSTRFTLDMEEKKLTLEGKNINNLRSRCYNKNEGGEMAGRGSASGSSSSENVSQNFGTFTCTKPYQIGKLAVFCTILALPLAGICTFCVLHLYN